MSKEIIRPFIPCMKDEIKEGREPFAVLKYKDIEIELDYTIMLNLILDFKSDIWCSTVMEYEKGKNKIIKEMQKEIDNE
jgi:hypothetical protein